MDFEAELSRVAQQYQDEGYAVVLRPQGDVVPPFARNFELDLLASRPGENVIVEVAPNRASLSNDPQLTRLADLVAKQPGWRLDVVVVEQNPPGGAEPTADQIREMYAEAERVLGANAPRAALMSAWAGLEATLRRLGQRTGVGGKTGTMPPTLVRELYSAGYISPDEFRFLEQVRAARTVIAHGLAPAPVDEGAVRKAIALGRFKLLESEQVRPILA
ncbi:hypothetical protein R5W23_005139 [Gemmata sp. JC673]|uniref:REase AHJR-like domain-containing protein n=1 Tax=Gemmata algarum TaxID=2975278 RepID=A0ABU5F7L4_9BACT|nr:hypothetical protein [Gemmata algarum]MDY3563527.1 hypothetical protein [Gemmata algarum]